MQNITNLRKKLCESRPETFFWKTTKNESKVLQNVSWI